jgi:hypothetical protein
MFNSPASGAAFDLKSCPQETDDPATGIAVFSPAKVIQLHLQRLGAADRAASATSRLAWVFSSCCR